MNRVSQLTEFWHFDFSAYFTHSTYGIMGSYRTFMHYVRSFMFKNAYWGHTAKNSGQKWDFAILEFWVDRAIGVGSFGSEPGFEQLRCAAAQSIFQIQKSQTGTLWTRPPPFGTSAENPGAHDLSRYQVFQWLTTYLWVVFKTLLVGESRGRISCS